MVTDRPWFDGFESAFHDVDGIRLYVRIGGRIQAACEDYRASAGIDLEHDRASRAAGERIACDLLVLWGERGVVHRLFDPLALWRAQCSGHVTGHAMPAGHFIPEELPQDTARELRGFFEGWVGEASARPRVQASPK